MQLLNLTLKREPFDEILSGKKKEEYREDKPFWDARFEGKEKYYTHILFRNGYSAGVPEMLVECKYIKKYVYVNDDDTYEVLWVLKLGKIVKTTNLKPDQKILIAKNKKIAALKS